MTQIVKRAIAAAMSLTMLAAATPVSPFYNAIQNAVMMQASAAENEYIVNYDNTDTFSIASLGDLNRFAAAVKGGYTFENKTITLADNFDMGTDELGYPNALSKPIGTSEHCFMGTFDGNNKKIRLDFSLESLGYAQGYAGLFSRVEGATIRNITVTGYEFCIPMNGDDCYAGGICGYAVSSNIYNCTNNADIGAFINCESTAGGICGYAVSSNIYNCNCAMAEVRCGSKAGGICGDAHYVNVYNCTNSATVEALNHVPSSDDDDAYAGGICGRMSGKGSVYNCTNNAAVNAEDGYDCYAGGICGSTSSDVNVYNCTNNAAVTAKDDDGYGHTGGIVGYSFIFVPLVLVHNCIDTGGNGICGGTFTLQEPDIDNCYVLYESNAEKFKGTQKDGEKTITEHLNTYVDEFNSTPSNDITLLKWEQGQDYPILKQETYAVGASLSLDGQIGVNISFYVNKDEGSTITINDETVDLAQLIPVKGIYTYTLWVAPKDAYNDITFKTVKGSDTIVKQTYSVKSQYVDVVLADTKHTKYDEKVFDMVNALDSYINYARAYFGIETDADKITTLESEIDTAFGTPTLSGINTGTIQNNDVVKYYGTSLILDSGVKVRHYIKIADGTDISKFKLAVNGNDITDAELTKSGIKSGSDDVYFFETDEFNPIDFNKKVSVTYDGTNVIDKYSVLSYIKLALSNETTRDTKLGTMCKALYNYHLKAGKY